MLYLGLISGTSADGIDAALVDISARGHSRLIATLARPYPAQLRRSILALYHDGPREIERLGRLDFQLGESFAATALDLLRHARIAPRRVRAIGSHGQTVRHVPGGGAPYTLQIGNPSVIAARTGITTVADFRARDLALGGQGAPLVPAFHAAAFRHPRHARAIVNVGGIANLTWLPRKGRGAVTGFDTGPGNALLDGWAQAHGRGARDDGGRWALGGTVHRRLLQRLLADSYLRLPPPKSTGREYFHLAWLRRRAGAMLAAVPARDVAATLAALTAESIARAVRGQGRPAGGVYICGGGVHNNAIMGELGARLAPFPVAPTDDLGLPADWVEATAFAWLACRTIKTQPGNLPAVTGARKAVVLGGIYPG